MKAPEAEVRRQRSQRGDRLTAQRVKNRPGGKKAGQGVTELRRRGRPTGARKSEKKSERREER